MSPADLPDRFVSKIEPDPERGCWVWVGARSRDGYGQVSVAGRIKEAHRITYEMLVGPIPEGLQIDHLCRNKPCVNPAHLEPVTGAENTRRRFELYVRCCRGHSLTDEANVRRNPDGRRVCRACDVIRQRECQQRKASR